MIGIYRDSTGTIHWRSKLWLFDDKVGDHANQYIGDYHSPRGIPINQQRKGNEHHKHVTTNKNMYISHLIWLVVWNIVLFSLYWGSSSQLRFIFFRGVGTPPTSDDTSYIHIWLLGVDHRRIHTCLSHSNMVFSETRVS